MMKSQLFYIYNYTMVKTLLFLLYCSLNFTYFLWAHHDHNKIAPCGMIKVFELNWIEIMIYTRLLAGGTYYPICMFPTALIGISDAFSAFVYGVRHLAHMLTVPPTKAWLLCATPAGMDLYIQAMPVGAYWVQSPGFPKIVW